MLKPVATLAAIAFVLSNYPAFGQEAPKPSDRTDCENFSWRVDRERDWFAENNLPRRASGARLRRIDRAVDLSLRPARQVDLFLPPDVKPRPNSFSGEVTFFGVPKPGLYQVTLSNQATIDVFENGARLKATDSTSAKHCPACSRACDTNSRRAIWCSSKSPTRREARSKWPFAEAEAAR